VSTCSYNHSVLTTKEEPPPPDAVLEALRAVAGEATDASARAITDACRKRCPDAKAREIAHFIHYRGQRANGIGNMTAFLIAKVPEHFEGRAFYLYRDQEARRIKAHFETQRQNLEETRKMCQDILNGSSSDETELAWAMERLSEIDHDLTRITQQEEQSLQAE